MKTCARCQQQKPDDDFYRRQAICKTCAIESATEWAARNPDKKRDAQSKYASKNKDKVRTRSREWARQNRERVNASRRAKYDPEASRYKMLKYRYGLSREQYDAMLLNQHDRCAACDAVLDGTIHVDHCHVTGRVRALLCRRCNMSLGQFNEDGSLIRKLAEYADGCHL